MSLPNPGFDFDSFDGDAFDTTSPGVGGLEISGVANERVSQEWYICDRCGGYYPRQHIINQNGLNVCQGPTTRNCFDLPGHSSAVSKLDLPYEQRPEPLPHDDEEL